MGPQAVNLLGNIRIARSRLCHIVPGVFAPALDKGRSRYTQRRQFPSAFPASGHSLATRSLTFTPVALAGSLAGRGASLDSQAKTCEVCTGFVRRIGAWCVLKDAFF